MELLRCQPILLEKIPLAVLRAARTMNSALFSVPFVRWADTVRVESGGIGTHTRQIYDHELVYVLEGDGEIVIGGKRHIARADSLFLVEPRAFHSFESPTQPQRLLGIHFDWALRDDLAEYPTFRAVGKSPDHEIFRPVQFIEGWDLTRRPCLDLRGRPHVRRALEAVVAEHHRNDSYSLSISGALLAASLSIIEREAHLLEEVASHQSAPPDAVRRVQRARELLEKPNAPLLSIGEIAATVGWSGDHLRRMCRAILDASPLEIQNAARIRRAQEWLRYGEMSVSEIADVLGWSDASHFTRAFKRATGMTPREWTLWEGAADNE